MPRRASASGDGSQGPGPSHSLSQAGSSNAALATVQADAAQMREENARLLDLLSRVSHAFHLTLFACALSACKTSLEKVPLTCDAKFSEQKDISLLVIAECW